MGLCTGEVSALLVDFLPDISSQFKATHQAIDDVALMRAQPGMIVLERWTRPRRSGCPRHRGARRTQ